MWDVIKDWVFDVIQFFYNGVGDWGMAIIIITIIFRIIVAPLVHKSTTANFAMQKVQPLLQEIQTKFADDPVRQREEMAAPLCGDQVQSACWLSPDAHSDACLHRAVSGAL